MRCIFFNSNKSILLLRWTAFFIAIHYPVIASPASPGKFEDTMAQRAQACVTCHGEHGRAGPDGYYPRLAGKPAGYLFNQMRHFRDGHRDYGLMARLMEPLDDAFLHALAQHFAGLKAPYPPPVLSAQTAEQARRGHALVERGDAARQVPSCQSCHGTALTGVAPHVPGLLGLPRDYLNGQLGAWRTGQRKAAAPDCMATLVHRLTPDDLNAVATWLSNQPVRNAGQAVTQASGPVAPPNLPCGSVGTPTSQQAITPRPAQP
jgi:cytochrome c553